MTTKRKIVFLGDYAALGEAIRDLQADEFITVNTPQDEPILARKRIGMYFRRCRIHGYLISVVPNLGVTIKKLGNKVDFRRKMSKIRVTAG